MIKINLVMGSLVSKKFPILSFEKIYIFLSENPTAN